VWVEPAQSGTLAGLGLGSVTAGNVYKLAGNGGTTATSDGTAGVQSNVAGTAELTLDGAGNVVLAVQSGSGFGNSPAIQVLAEVTGTYYGTAMTAGDVYTVAGGSTPVLAALSGPTSVLSEANGNLLFTDGAASSANLDELSGVPTSVNGGAVTLNKTTALVGNYPEKVSGTGWTADTTVTLNECATTYYSASTCDAANQVTATLGTGTHAGTFTSQVVHLATGVIDTKSDTCGLSGSPTCDIVVVGNTGDATASAALGFTVPSIAAKKTTAVLGNFVDGVKAVGFPIGDTVVAQECDASVSVPSTVSSNCDASTQITGTVAASGSVVFSPTGVTMRVGSAYSDTAAGTCASGGTCDIVVTDSNNASFAFSEAVTFASPTTALAKTTAVLGNFADKVKTTGFPIGDTVVAQECDSSGNPSNVSTNCDAATQITGTVGSNGVVVFSPVGVTLGVGSAYSDTAAGTCAPGASCNVVVTDSGNSAFAFTDTVGFATTTFTVKKTTGVLGNYDDIVKTTGFPIGDTVVAQECDSSVSVPSTVSSNCDAATQITGTVGSTGVVVFSPTGVTLRAGSSYNDPASGTCAAGATCEIVATDSGNAAIGFEVGVTFAAPTASVHLATMVPPNYVDHVAAGSFPIGDTVTAQECDSSVNASNVATNCDGSTQITGTVGSNGVVTFTSTGVTIHIGSAYGTGGVDAGGGSCPAGGTCDVVVNDSTEGGFFVAIPVGLHN
jgi:hypothetical protein